MPDEWIIHNKVEVSAEWDGTVFTSKESYQMANLTMKQLLNLIKDKGAGLILYDGKNPICLTLVDSKTDVQRD